MKKRLQRWLFNLIIPEAIMDTIWVILHALRKIYATRKDEVGYTKMNNLIEGVRHIIPKHIREQKLGF